MAFQNKYIFLVISVMVFFNLNAKERFPKIATKQNIRNIRFISSNNKYSLFQNRSGSLMLSLNFSIFPLLNSTPGTNYIVSTSSSKKYITIEKDISFHTYLSTRHLHQIYVTKWMSKDDPIYIGFGNSPQLHLNDTFISYYSPYTSTIYFKDIRNLVLEYSIKISAKSNPYFIPYVIMRDRNSILYTDINDSGVYGLMSFSRATGKSKLLWKGKSIHTFIEMCKMKNKFIIFLKSSDPTGTGSKMLTLPVDFKSFKDSMLIYESTRQDYGNIKCTENNKIFFVKKVKTNRTDVAVIDLTTKKVRILTDFGNVSQLINMDDTILLPLDGELYVIEGRSDFKKDTLTK